MTAVTSDRPVQINESFKPIPESKVSDHKTKRVVEKKFQCPECKRWFGNEANIIKGHFLCASNLNIRRVAKQSNAQAQEMPQTYGKPYREEPDSPPIKVLSQ